MNRHPLSTGETMLAHHEQETEGLILYTKIGGFAGSSTRTEVAGAIIALLAHGPIHVGSDGKAFVDRANKCINLLKKNKKPRIKWKLISDGDLWEHFFKALEAKGWRAFKATWVKGHATQEHINNKISTLANKTGNDKADKVADIGTKLHGRNVMQMAASMQHRHKGYQTLHMQVASHLIEGYKIHRELTERRELREKQKAEKKDRAEDYQPLTYAPIQSTHGLTAQASIASHPGFQSKNINNREIESFLGELMLCKAGKDVRSITWLELYTLYRLKGYLKPIKDPEDMADKRATLDKQIRAFKSQVRAQTQRTLIPEHADFFKPGNTTPDNLKGVGLVGRYVGGDFNIYIEPELCNQLAYKIVLLGHSIGAKKAHDHINGGKKIIPIKLKVKGEIGWDNSFKANPSPQSKTVWETKLANQQLEIPQETAFFKCPTCEMSAPSTAGPFKRDKLDSKIKCDFCHKTLEAATWTCVCSKPWYTCTVHRAYETRDNLKSNKRKVCPTSGSRCKQGKSIKFESPEPHILLQEDIARSETKRRLNSLRDDIVLGNESHAEKRPRVLGPILSQRFPDTP